MSAAGRESGRDFAWLDEVRREHDEMVSDDADRMPTAEEVASWPRPTPDYGINWGEDPLSFQDIPIVRDKVIPVAIHRDHEFEYAKRTTKTGRRDETGKTSFETTTEQAPLTEAPLTEARRAYIASLSRSFDCSIYCEPERPDFGLNRFVVHGQADEWEPRTGPLWSRLLKWLVRRSL